MPGKHNGHQLAELTIPAAYLEDARRAAVREVRSDGEGLQTGATDPEDRSLSARILRRDALLLDQLIAATGDTKLMAEHDATSAPLVHLLEAMVDVFTERLGDVAQYGPTPMGDVLDVAAGLRWAAEEAIRLEPASGDRLAAVDWQRTLSDRKVA